MTTTETWWDTIFEGDLSHGVNRDRLEELEAEQFLFFDEVGQFKEHTH